jgi:hypothetical protein
MTSSEWLVPFIVIAIIVLILAFGGRRKGDTDGAAGPASGAELVERMQRTLGIGVMVESVESVEPGDPGDSVTIRATLMYGSHATQVAVSAKSEAEAWKELARAAIAWRKSDYQHVPTWPGGG